jgi:phospholipid/cholesterol/gamma-HCH transport system ATP-binding protein
MADNSDQNPVEVSGLKKSFGAQKVLDGVEFHVVQGETLAVLGKSGAGKSVLLKLMIGLQQPDSGSVKIHGEEIATLKPDKLSEVRKKMGYLFQNGALYDSLSVEDNVDFPLSHHTKMPDGERQKKVKELLANVGMEGDASKMPAELSGGMQKRVGLARALALDPDILLFDEPTAGLDPITADEIGALILNLKKQRKMTAVVVTHDIHGAKRFADRLVLLRDGEIALEGTFQDLQKSKDDFVVRFLKDAC